MAPFAKPANTTWIVVRLYVCGRVRRDSGDSDGECALLHDDVPTSQQRARLSTNRENLPIIAVPYNHIFLPGHDPHIEPALSLSPGILKSSVTASANEHAIDSWGTCSRAWARRSF